VLPSQVIENVFFTYDPAGELVVINNTIPVPLSPLTVGGPFSYTIIRDPLYRVLSMTGALHQSPVLWQSFHVNFTYSHINTLTSKSQVVTLFTATSSSVNPLLTYNVTYTYDSGRPRLPSEVLQVRPGSYQKFCFLYDNNGNTVTIITHNVANTSSNYAQSQFESLCFDYFHNTTNTTYLIQSMAYDERNRLQSLLTSDSQQLYQYNDRVYRVAKNSPNGLNLYLDRTYQIRSGRSSKYYVACGTVVGKDFGTNEVCRTNLPVHSPTCQYFYHTTTGATNWVSDMLGKPIAYFSYLMEGEPWISTVLDDTQAPASTDNLPIRPSGNELDETGYLYTPDNEYFDATLQLHL
jgi:hypothetical protein